MWIYHSGLEFAKSWSSYDFSFFLFRLLANFVTKQKEGCLLMQNWKLCQFSTWPLENLPSKNSWKLQWNHITTKFPHERMSSQQSFFRARLSFCNFWSQFVSSDHANTRITEWLVSEVCERGLALFALLVTPTNFSRRLKGTFDKVTREVLRRSKETN